MVRHHCNGKFSKEIRSDFPKIHLDKMADFASIKLRGGVEAKSYIKNGFIFCEDKLGRIIEIQILNLSELKNLKQEDADVT